MRVFVLPGIADASTVELRCRACSVPRKLGYWFPVACLERIVRPDLERRGPAGRRALELIDQRLAGATAHTVESLPCHPSRLFDPDELGRAA
jgi:hypothetical protein